MLRLGLEGRMLQQGKRFHSVYLQCPGVLEANSSSEFTLLRKINDFTACCSSRSGIVQLSRTSILQNVSSLSDLHGGPRIA